MKQKYFYSILLLFLGLLGFSQTLDQQNAPASIGGGSFTVSPSQDVGQSFTAGMTGDLSQINIRVGNWGSIFVAGDFQLRIIDGNGYGGTVLNTTTFSIPSAPATSNYDELAIVLSATVSITSGNMYTIDLKGTTGTVSTHGANPDYANGGLYFASGNNALYDGYNLWFKTFVNVPTPATHLNFDGVNDNVSLPATAINNLTLGTIEVWVYPTASILENQTICAKQSNNENTYAYLSIGGGAKVNYQSTNGSSIQSISTIISNQWTHIAVAFTSTQAKIYINGILDKTVSGSFSLPNDTSVTATTIGAILGDGGGQYFTGSLDEFRVWNIARTAEQIAGSMNCELQGTETGLVSYYQFNQGIDQANNAGVSTLNATIGSNGTLTNFTLTGSTSNWLAGSPVTTGSVVPENASATSPIVYIQGDTASALSATTGTNGTGLMWYTTATGGTGSTTAPTPSTATAGSTSYWVASTNANGCESERIEIVVTVSLPATHLNFDGINDHVNLGTSLATALNGTTALTIEAWINPSVLNGWNNIITDYNGSYHKLLLRVRNNNNIQFWLNGTVLNSSFTVPLDTWTHVAAVYDGSNMYVYANGVLVASQSATVSLPTTTDQFNIGSRVGGSELFTGNIDEVRVWNTARTVEQINGSMNCELQGSESGLVAYYQFNQGVDQADNTSITTLTDATSNGNDGTLTNFTLTDTTSNWLAGSVVETGSVVPTAPIVTTPVTYNQNDTASALTATTGGSGLLWYTTETGGTGSTSAPTPDTSTAGSTSYWVSSTNANGCESERVKIIVNVNAEAAHLNFDGSNDYVSCGTTNLPTGTSARTIEAWIKTTQTTGSQSIINYGNQTINNSRFGFINASGNLYFVGEGNDYNTNTLIADGNWHHVAATYEASTLKIYINGALNATVTKVLNTNNNIFNIGASCNPTPGEFFNGSIDEVRIWDVALSQTDIQDTMNCELIGGQNNVVAYYKFNQGFDASDNTSVTTLIDEIGNHNGTLINFALTGATSNWQSGSTVTIGNTCSAILSSSSFEAVANLKVYPNPSTGIFTIASEEELTITVYDIVGKVIKTQTINNGNNTLNISNYNAGVYFLNAVSIQGETKTFKLIKN